MDEPVGTDQQTEARALTDDLSPEGRLQISVEPATSGATVVHVAGDLDMLTSVVLHDRLRPHLDQPGQALVLNLSGIGFLGSAGLSELVAASDAANRNGVQLRLVAASRVVLRPLEITGLLSLFQVFDSVETAVAQV